MSISDRTDRVLDRAARGEADIGEIEACISETRADLDRNLSAIEQHLSTDALIDQAMTYFRSSAPTEFFTNFGHAVKDNPVPTTLLGVSLGWLMLSGRRRGLNGDAHHAYGGTEWDADMEVYEDREFYGRGGSYGENVADAAHDIADSGRGVVRRVGESMRSGASAAADHASSLADRTSSLAERASSLASGMSDMGHRVGDKFSDVGGKMSDANRHAQEVFQRARERVAHARRTLAQQPRRMQAGAHQMAEQHPFMLGAIAFVAGAAIAASLKRTRLEDDMMGDYRDQALSEAESRARAELDQGIASARTALEGDGGVAESEQHESSSYGWPSADAQPESWTGEEEAGHEQPASSQDRFH
jgi:hypothetical protein